GAILGPRAAGLLLTAGFAGLAVDKLNPISLAFGVLFIGLAVDFSIQFSVRYRDQRHRLGALPAALYGAGETIGPALMLAAGATAIGFFAFVPTQYTGIRELGWIGGTGMIIAIALNPLLVAAVLARGPVPRRGPKGRRPPRQIARSGAGRHRRQLHPRRPGQEAGDRRRSRLSARPDPDTGNNAAAAERR